MSKSRNPFPKEFQVLYRWYIGGPKRYIYIPCRALANNGWYRFVITEDIQEQRFHVHSGGTLSQPLRYGDIVEYIKDGTIIILEDEDIEDCNSDPGLIDLL